MLKENIVILNKKPSEELQNLINSFAYTSLQRAEIVEKIIIKAEEENIKPEEVGQMIKNALRKQGLSESTINRAVPDDFKNKKMQAIRSKRKPKVQKLKDIPPPLHHDEDWKDIHLRSIDILELRNWCNQQLGIKRKTVRGFIDDQLYMS